ncbi:AAA family ATPase [Limnohabitans sp.]|uniref:AAA family ATPase n=1 Tax=Limnohabitans sp. TaxID=1907725 RepID=UPI003342C0A3
MTVAELIPSDLRLTVDPASLGFEDTSELRGLALSWVGQERAETAARFGLQMRQPGYNLLVLGSAGMGRTRMLTRMLHEQAALRPVPPDLCVLNNFAQTDRPLVLRVPAGQGRLLRQGMALWVQAIQEDVPQRLLEADFWAARQELVQTFKAQTEVAYTALTAYAQAHHFAVVRDQGHMVFTLKDAQGAPVTATKALLLSLAERTALNAAEEALRAELDHYLETVRVTEQAMAQALDVLRQRFLRPVLADGLTQLRQQLNLPPDSDIRLAAYMEQVLQALLEKHRLLMPGEDEATRRTDLAVLLSSLSVNLVVDHHASQGAPVVVEENPVFRNLLGGMVDDEALMSNFADWRAGSLLRAHGGFLLLHLQDLLADAAVWESLRRLMRSGRLESSGASPRFSPGQTCEAMGVDVKLVLIASVAAFDTVQEADPEWVRRFACKVDFAETFKATPQTAHAMAVGVAHTCERLGLLHCSAAAVAQIMEESHRAAGDQTRQCGRVGLTRALVVESHALAQARGAARVEAQDVLAASQAQRARRDGLETRVQDSIASGERLLVVSGERVAQVNGLTVMDQGDHSFGVPVRVTARSFAGDEGLLNIEREVDMSGPIHDKGVLILHSYLSGLFAHIAPLSMNAAVVFEQEYGGVEGDSASCAELYALLSSLSGLPLRQGIAVTGAVNQQGDLLPVGNINEKIEGYFRSCESLGLDGQQGVLMPARNRRHLMLAPQVVHAVARGDFHIYVANQVSEGMSLLTGFPYGHWGPGGYALGSVLGRVQTTLQRFRQACELLASNRSPRRSRSPR